MQRKPTTVQLAFLILAAAALARLLLHLSLMPPYAGLDEIYHVARVVFVAAEKRNPTIAERSIPEYLDRSIRQEAGATPAFGVIGSRWPQVVASGARIVEESVRPEDRTYVRTNYEAQQPSLYYWLAAGFAGSGDPMSDLRRLRLLSLIFALIVVVATAWIGYRAGGAVALLAAAILVSLPTWLTLVLRAGNDAVACAAIAVGLASSLAGPRKTSGWIVEGVSWAIAIATKLYSWPVSVVIPLIWWQQRASRRRMAVVSVMFCLSLLGTVAELDARTRNPIGLFAFDPLTQQTEVTPVAVSWKQVAEIIISTAAWTSGQHWNAFTPLGVALYLGALLLLIAAGAAAGLGRQEWRRLVVVVGTAALAFAVAQVVKLSAYLRLAHAAGEALPAGGKEGWYWYSMAPLVVGLLLTFALLSAGKRSWAIPLVIVWFVAWDMIVHEGALYRDWAGAAAPERRGLLFRWAPVDSEAGPAPLAVGPFAPAAPYLRALHLSLTGVLTALVIRRGGAPAAAVADDRDRGS